MDASEIQAMSGLSGAELNWNLHPVGMLTASPGDTSTGGTDSAGGTGFAAERRLRRVSLAPSGGGAQIGGRLRADLLVDRLFCGHR